MTVMLTPGVFSGLNIVNEDAYFAISDGMLVGSLVFMAFLKQPFLFGVMTLQLVLLMALLLDLKLSYN